MGAEAEDQVIKRRLFAGKGEIALADAVQPSARRLRPGIGEIEHAMTEPDKALLRDGHPQPVDPVEVMRRRGMGHASPRRAFAQGQRVEPALRQQFYAGFDQRLAQVAVMVAGLVFGVAHAGRISGWVDSVKRLA